MSEEKPSSVDARDQSPDVTDDSDLPLDEASQKLYDQLVSKLHDVGDLSHKLLADLYRLPSNERREVLRKLGEEVDRYLERMKDVIGKE